MFSPLTPELLEHRIQANNSSLREYIKDLHVGITALWEFVTIGKADFCPYVVRGLKNDFCCIFE